MTTSFDLREFDAARYRARHDAEVLTGCRVLDRGDDWAAAAMVLPAVTGDSGVPLGWLGVLADSAAGQSLGPIFARGLDVRTVDLRLDAVGPRPRAGTVATAHGELISCDDRTGLSRVRILDHEGVLIGMATARFIAVPGSPPTPSPACPTVGNAASAVESFDPVEVYGIGAIDGDADSMTLTVDPPPALCNMHGVVHGGIQVGLLEYAMSTLAAKSAASTSGYPEALDITVAYRRPVIPADDGSFLLRTEVEHRGRQVVAVNATAWTPDGRLSTSARGTFLSPKVERP